MNTNEIHNSKELNCCSICGKMKPKQLLKQAYDYDLRGCRVIIQVCDECENHFNELDIEFNFLNK
jgi:hypothetical protein